MKECMKSRPNPTAKFNYAWALIRSKEVRFLPSPAVTRYLALELHTLVF